MAKRKKHVRSQSRPKREAHETLTVTREQFIIFFMIVVIITAVLIR